MSDEFPLDVPVEFTDPRTAAPTPKFAPMAEPVEFPKPRDPSIADRVEATAEQIQVGFPYRTLLDCRQLAARLVDEVMCWDTMWPEAEGDCGCPDHMEGHRPDCIWIGEART